MVLECKYCVVQVMYSPLKYCVVQVMYSPVVQVMYSPLIVRWCVWGLLWGCLGTFLCGGTKNTGMIPMNNNLWTLSLILNMGAIGYLLMVVLYVLVCYWLFLCVCIELFLMWLELVAVG